MQKVFMEDVKCPNGCQAKNEILFKAKDRLHKLPGEYFIVKCKTCGLIRTNPRPTPDNIGFYYPEDYGPYISSRVNIAKNANRLLKLSIFKTIYQALVQYNSEVTPKLMPGRMLEIGCASGAFLARMAARGWHVEGVEFSEKAAANARALGFNVHTGALEKAPDPTEHYDLIVGWMVVEHLHDPLGALTKLARWTNPQGWLAISVPNAASAEFMCFKEASYALQVPTHLYHFTPDTLSRLLAKSGWRVKRVFHQRVLNNLFLSLANILEDRGAPIWLVKLFKRYPQGSCYSNLIFYPLALLLSAFGQTGRITVWAQKV